jgi:hypothetical protein
LSQVINFIKLDFNRSNNVTIPTIEWDQGSRFVRVQLQNNNQSVDITGSQVVITVIRNDLEEIIESCNILNAKDGLIEFEISKSMVARQGDMLCQLKLSDNDSLLSSQLFKISVNNTLMVSLEESRSDMDVLIHALGEVQDIDNRFNKTNYKIDENYQKLNTQLSQTASVVGGVNNYDVNKYIKSHGVTTGLQMIIDDVCEKGQGLVLLNGIYEIDRPLTVERTNNNLATSIKFYGNATIRKSGNFVGDRLVTFKIGYHDEDCITFDGITFDGVDRTVNGIDNYNESLAYNENPSSINDGNQSKYVNFNQCTFINCYTGARLGSLSYVFTGCLFHSNIYAIKLNCSANANTFTGCSIRRNVIGVELRQLDSTVGTIANAFYTCTIESNQNLGVASYNDRDTKIIGCYFENNGWKIDSNYANFEQVKCHIYYGSTGGAGRHYIDSFFNTAKYDIGGKQFVNGVIDSNVKVKFDIIQNSFIRSTLSSVEVTNTQNHESKFILGDNKEYFSPKLSSDIICITDNYNSDKTAISRINKETKTITDISDLSKVKLLTIKFNSIKQAKTDLMITLNGLNSGGNISSQGFIIAQLLISGHHLSTVYISKTGDVLFYGGVDGQSDTVKSNSIFNTSSELLIERISNNEFDVYVTNLKNTHLINWGQYDRIEVNNVAETKGLFKKIDNHVEFI